MSKRSLFILLCHIKKNIKSLDMGEKELDDLSVRLHDILGDLVLMNYNMGKKGKHWGND